MNKKKNQSGFVRFTKKNLLINFAIIAAYLTLALMMGNIRTDQVFLMGFYLLMFYTNDKTRKFIVGFSIFIIYWVIYDSMRLLPNFEVSPVHIKEPYEIEKALFGISLNGVIHTPNEYFNLIQTHFLDFISGFFYLNWVPVPLAFGLYLYYYNRTVFMHYSLVFLLTNLIGFGIYYIYPAAPPWYVSLYGFELVPGVQGNSAGLARFDELLGIHVFAGIYNKNANVFAAIPSLHAAYPVVVLFYSIKNMFALISPLLIVFMLGICFSAVYSGHHYIIDVLFGIATAVVSILLFHLLLRYTNLSRLIKII
jgi:hypothetical protein